MPVTKKVGVDSIIDWSNIPPNIRLSLYVYLVGNAVTDDTVRELDECISINVDKTRLACVLQKLNDDAIRRREVEDIKIEFIRRGVSLATMESMFECSRSEVDMLRQKLDVKTARGRPARPDIAVCEEIINEWNKITDTQDFSADFRRQILLLHDSFRDFPLHTIIGIINDEPTYPAAGNGGNLK